jgi:hypothetical protein
MPLLAAPRSVADCKQRQLDDHHRVVKCPTGGGINKAMTAGDVGPQRVISSRSPT